MGRGLTSKVIAQQKEQEAWHTLEATAGPAPPVDKDAARAAKRLEIEARLAALKLQQAEAPLEAGTTGTLHGGKLDGCRLTVGSYNGVTCVATCIVTLTTGADQTIEVPRASIKDLAGPRPKAACRHELSVERMDAVAYFSQECRVTAWLDMHRAAFKAETELLHAHEGGQQTVDIPPDAARKLAERVFCGATSPFSRECYSVFLRGSTDACAYATVDIDPDPDRVCHLRLLMVAPALQRQGIGTALLDFVVRQYPDRHLGVQFGNHSRHLEPLFRSAGFMRIGEDKLRTHMAIRRKA